MYKHLIVHWQIHIQLVTCPASLCVVKVSLKGQYLSNDFS